MEHGERTIAARLLLCFGDFVLRSIVLAKPRVMIGRRRDNDIALDDLTVSGRHATLELAPDEGVIHDLGSRNGTLVNGTAVRSRTLRHGDVIGVGLYTMRFLIDARPAPPLAACVDADASLAVLEPLGGPERGAGHRLDRPIVAVRGAGGQLATVSWRAEGWFITHLEGPSMPLVNGAPIGLAPHPLDEGDLVELAGAILRFRTRGLRR